MKQAKWLGAILAVAMLLAALPVQVGAADAAPVTLRNGEAVKSDVDKDYPGAYVMNISSEGDLRLDLKTDGHIYIEVVSSEGRHVAAQEYDEMEHYADVGKEAGGTGRYYLQAPWDNRTVNGYFTFHVKPGTYRITLSTPDALCFTELTATVLSATAVPTRSTVLVNGKEVAFDAYTINENNYFKLRDLAKALNGTDKGFEVTWDGDENAISMTSKSSYTSVGGELARGDGSEKAAALSTSDIYLDEAPAQFVAYTINQNNYFKLRDVGQAFGFDVTWDGAKNTIVIDTTKGYTPD